MQLFGLTITRQKALPLAPISARGSWWPLIRESFTGAWQRNIETRVEDVLSNGTVYACITLIAGDISKLPLRLIAQDENGIWAETENPAYSPVLREPNRYQNRIQFIEYWLLSKLIHGNTYVLKARDDRNVVTRLYVLDPTHVKVLQAPDGSVFYELGADMLSGVAENVIVPARDIIHDRMFPLFHPLVGISPIFACNLSARQALRMQQNSEEFFANHAQPGGIITAPNAISPEAAERIEKWWAANFGGPDNSGKTAVLGDGLHYEPMAFTLQESQLIEQLKLAVEDVCRAFHMPLWKIGGPLPPYGNVQAANVEYYSVTLQGPMENLELCLDEGLSLPRRIGVDFDITGLLRMDTATQMDIAVKGVGGAIYSPNEGRATFDRPPVKGGETPFLQEQNWPIAHLASRELPTRPPTPPKPIVPPDDHEPEDEMDEGATAKAAGEWLRKDLAA